MPRTSTSLLLLAGLAALSAGCVAKSELETAKQASDACERDKGVAQKAAADCETRLQAESKRWDSIETQLTTSLPATLKNFEDERAKIIQIVPEKVRNEVGNRLDRYFVNVSKQFDRMDGKVEGLREQLAESRVMLSQVSADTQQVGTKVEETHRAVLSGQAKLSDSGKRVGDIVASIVDFDRARINCDKCKEKIKLKGRGKEELLAFHADLIKKLQSAGIQTAEAGR